MVVDTKSGAIVVASQVAWEAVDSLTAWEAVDSLAATVVIAYSDRKTSTEAEATAVVAMEALCSGPLEVADTAAEVSSYLGP